MATIQAEQSALADAQRSAGTVASACTGAAGTVSAMSGLAMAGCDIVAAAWSSFAAATGGYVSAFGEAAGILGGKIGTAAQSYATTDTNVSNSMGAR